MDMPPFAAIASMNPLIDTLNILGGSIYIYGIFWNIQTNKPTEV
jgi:hypothetical protein